MGAEQDGKTSAGRCPRHITELVPVQLGKTMSANTVIIILAAIADVALIVNIYHHW